VIDEPARVRQAQHGSDEAFTDLVEAYQTPVYNLCYRMLGDPESAEDAAQETFLRAYQNLHRYDENRPFPTWLLSIAAHYCIDRLRRRRFAVTSLDEEQDEGGLELPDLETPNPEAESVRREQREQMQLALNRLSSVDRAAVVLRYWHEYSEVEIAETLNLTVSAVKSRLHRARRDLADHWEIEASQPRPERRPHESPAV
jgi:RNA polymerase sigma-70 factor (ECF subfamily)